MLTVRQLQPTVVDLNQLIRNGDYIGYQSGSFVKDLLKSLNVDERKIRSYRIDQYAEALMKGSRNGGVAAILDEIPHLKLFMSKQCGNHSVIGRVYKTGGFGYVSNITVHPLYIFCSLLQEHTSLLVFLTGIHGYTWQ